MMISRDPHSASILETSKELWAAEGPRGFMKGCLLRVAYIAFGSVLFFCSYENIKAKLKKYDLDY
jgi:hypothetical protein